MIFVTGGTGLIGSHLLFELVSAGYEVTAIKRTNSNTENVAKVFGYYSETPDDLMKKIRWVEGDLRDKYLIHLLLKGVTHVYHSAGYISFNNRKKEELFSVNIEGTANMVDASLENNVQKLCYVSSIATLGYEEGKHLIDEKTKWKPDKKSSFYSISKFKAEMEVWRGFSEGLNTVIVNPSVVLGPGFWNKGVGSVMKKIVNGFNYYSDGTTGYVDVRDVVKIMMLLMKTDISGEQYILNSENLSFEEIISYFSKALGYEKPPKPASKLVAGMIWRSEMIRSYLMNSEPLITYESLKMAYESNMYSNQKIKDLLNFSFIPIKNTVDLVTEKFLSETGKEIPSRILPEKELV